MASRRLYEILGLAGGFVVIDYGFNFLATGFPGARTLTSQLIAANLIVGGSVAILGSLYYLLKPSAVPAPASPEPTLSTPDVGVELIVEEETPPKSDFYRNITYIGYLFTVLGLFSAADLVLQVFIRSIYNEARWWIEVLLVTFGVLSYTIFGSVGRLGSEEEAKLAGLVTTPTPVAGNVEAPESLVVAAPPSYPESLVLRMADFTRSSSGEYERRLAPGLYDMFRVERDMITVWREDRRGMRSVYLAGPYELSNELLREHLNRGEQVKIGLLELSVESIRDLVALQGAPTVTSS